MINQEKLTTTQRGKIAELHVATALTRACHNAVADRGAHAVIPTRRNAKPWKPTTPGAEARNEILRATKYLGRAIWR